MEQTTLAVPRPTDNQSAWLRFLAPGAPPLFCADFAYNPSTSVPLPLCFPVCDDLDIWKDAFCSYEIDERLAPPGGFRVDPILGIGFLLSQTEDTAHWVFLYYHRDKLSFFGAKTLYPLMNPLAYKMS